MQADAECEVGESLERLADAPKVGVFVFGILIRGVLMARELMEVMSSDTGQPEFKRGGKPVIDPPPNKPGPPMPSLGRRHPNRLSPYSRHHRRGQRR